MQSSWLVGRNVIKIKKHRFSLPLLTCSFFFSPFDVLAGSALLQPFHLDNGYSYYVSTCFASPYQLILIRVYEKYFATQ